MMEQESIAQSTKINQMFGFLRGHSLVHVKRLVPYQRREEYLSLLQATNVPLLRIGH